MPRATCARAVCALAFLPLASLSMLPWRFRSAAAEFDCAWAGSPSCASSALQPRAALAGARHLLSFARLPAPGARAPRVA
eukprot:4454285-Pyramimonas_sp.AAC.1